MGDPVKQNKLVVIAPLDWGLGHISRVIPIATQLKHSGFDVRFAIPKSLNYIAAEYGLEIIPIAGYNVKYFSKLPPLLSVFIQLPKFVLVFLQEYLQAKRLVKTYNPALLISDNRPFFRNRKTTSIYLTHQLNLPLSSIFQKLVHPLYHRLIAKFDLCLVPDTVENTFAGILSKTPTIGIPIEYCGILSRFQHCIVPNQHKFHPEYTILYIASGPQPQRDKTSQKVVALLSKFPGKHAMVGYVHNHNEPNIDFFGHLPTVKFFNLALRSKVLFSKSGYTTIMDAVALQKPLIMWPTQGQWEQQILANHLKHKQGFVVLSSPEELLRININNIPSPPKPLFTSIYPFINQHFTQYGKH